MAGAGPRTHAPRPLRAAILIALGHAVLPALLLGCSLPARALPSERAVFGGRLYRFGSESVAPGVREDVLGLERAGKDEESTIFLRFREGKLTAEALDPGRPIPRPADADELDEAAALLSPRNAAYRAGLAAWLEARVDRPLVERLVGLEAKLRRASQEGLVGELLHAYRSERVAFDADEREARKRGTVFAGLFGWQRGVYSGYSWSFPLHLERFDRSEEMREVAIFPLLSGVRCERFGVAALTPAPLVYVRTLDAPLERAGGLVLLGCGRACERTPGRERAVTLALPLLFWREREQGEDVVADGGRVSPGERSSTNLLLGLWGFLRERTGVYRDRGALRFVGRDRAEWRLLPLASHRRDERSRETMLWPLLGFGWGEEGGRGYVRILYFLRW